MRIVFLGTGTSTGVPVVRCPCEVCHSEDPRDKRMRCSLYLELGEIHLLVDTGPDFRIQALRFGVKKVDAVLYTHGHVDHVAGFDDLRVFCWGRDKKLPLFAGKETLAILRKMFGWAFQTDNTHAGYIKPEAREINGSFRLGSTEIIPVPVVHSAISTLGFRFNFSNGRSLLYMSDVKKVPTSSLELARNIDVLIVDALRHTPHKTHFTVEEALKFASEVQAKQTWLTHLGHEVSHESLQRELPNGVNVAYDGLNLNEALEPCPES